MKAIILAAGRGTRLYPLTLSKPKGLLSLHGTTILDRLVDQFHANGIQDVLIVVGFQKEILQNHFGNKVRYREYKFFEKTNNLHTLISIEDELNDDVIITFADLVIDDAIMENLIDHRNDITVAVDTKKVLDGTMRVKVDHEKLISMTTTTVKEASGNFIGILKISKKGCSALLAELSQLKNSHFNDYYTIAIDQMAKKGKKIDFFDVRDFQWREIDTKDEYDELLKIYKQFNC